MHQHESLFVCNTLPWNTNLLFVVFAEFGLKSTCPVLGPDLDVAKSQYLAHSDCMLHIKLY